MKGAFGSVPEGEGQMSDVLVELKVMHSDWTMGSEICDIALLERAICEIERLRADAVVTRQMASFREIKQEIKNGASV